MRCWWWGYWRDRALDAEKHAADLRAALAVVEQVLRVKTSVKCYDAIVADRDDAREQSDGLYAAVLMGAKEQDGLREQLDAVREDVSFLLTLVPTHQILVDDGGSGLYRDVPTNAKARAIFLRVHSPGPEPKT